MSSQEILKLRIRIALEEFVKENELGATESEFLSAHLLSFEDGLEEMKHDLAMLGRELLV